jgi:hypothetical protein
LHALTLAEVVSYKDRDLTDTTDAADDLISMTTPKEDHTPARTQPPSPCQPRRVNMGTTSRSITDVHDSFANLLPVVRARTFTHQRPYTPLPAPAPKPRTTKPMTPVTDDKTQGGACMDLELTPRHIARTIGVMKNEPTVFKAMEPTTFGSATNMDSYVTIHESYENEARAQQLQESTNIERLAQDQFYTVKEFVPSYLRSSTGRRISPVDENIVAPQPRWRVDDFIEEHEHKLGNPRSLEDIRAELEAIKIEEFEDEASPPLLARDNPLDGYSNGLSNGHGNRCSHDQLHIHPHDQFHSHSNGFQLSTTNDGRHLQYAGGSNEKSQSHSNGTSIGNGPPNDRKNGYHTPRAQSPSQDSTTILPASSKEGVVPIVRLTRDVYDSLCIDVKSASQQKTQFLDDKALSQIEMAKLEQRIQDLEREATRLTGTACEEPQNKHVVQHLQDQIENLQQEVTRLIVIEQHNSIQLEQYKQQKYKLGAILSQKDHDIRKLESDMNALRARIQAKAREHDQQRDGRVKRLVDEIAKRDKEIEVLRNDVIQGEKSAAELRGAVSSVEGERDSLLQTENQAHEYITRIKNLADTLSEREELYKRQTQNVESLQAAIDKLTMENHLLRNSSPSQSMINELKKKLEDKTAEASRNVNELRDMRKRYDNSQAAIEKAADNQKSLRGAAHLTKPSQNVNFHRTVFGCVECYVKGLDCDSGVRCKNCTDSDSMCSRWRCSLVHILKYCPPDRPCGLVHGQDGWVSTREARPQW